MGRIFVARIGNGLQERLEQCLGFLDWERAIPAQGRVFIKPNFTYTRYKEGVTTSPQLLEALVRCLKQRTSHVAIVESNGGYNAWKAEEAFAGHGVYQLEKRYGCRAVNLSTLPAEMIEVSWRGQCRQIPMPSVLLHECDALISAPVPKIHCMTGMSGTLKNLWGCIPHTMRLRYHHCLPAALVEINRSLKPALVVGDGQYMLDRSGPMQGDPVRMDLLLGASDYREFDLAACKIMGLNPGTIGHLAYARKKGLLPASLNETVFNQRLEDFATHTFRLHRTARNWAVLAAFHSRILTTLIYDSAFGDWLHRVFYRVAGRPAVA